MMLPQEVLALQHLLLLLYGAMATEAFPQDHSATTDGQHDRDVISDVMRNDGDVSPSPKFLPDLFKARQPLRALPFLSYQYLAENPNFATESPQDDRRLTSRSDAIDPRDDFSKRHDKQKDDRKFRYDPALRLMGLGKRDGSRPKYNPGLKFIGLGKRVFPSQQTDPSFKMVELERRDIRMRTMDEFNPYLSLLALTNLSNFFDVLKSEFSFQNGAHRKGVLDHSVRGPDGYVLIGDSSPKMKHAAVVSPVSIVEGGGSNLSSDVISDIPVFTRARKPTRFWKSKSRPSYDPGFIMTGLGK